MSSASSAPPGVAAGDVPRIAVSDLTIAYGSFVVQRLYDRIAGTTTGSFEGTITSPGANKH